VSFDEFNNWLVDHQLLVTLVVTPIVAAVVGAAATWYSGRRNLLAARTERMHQAAVEIARYRQAWIDSLRDDLSEYAGIIAMTYIGAPPVERAERIAMLAMRIRMRMNRDDPDYQRLTEVLSRDLERFLLGKRDEQEEGEALVPVSQLILKREWERLKADLREATK
jgi:hypothetical protein